MPDPDGPITAVNECRANSALTLSSARTAPGPCRYSLLTSRNATGTAGCQLALDSSRSRAVNRWSIVISFLPAGASVRAGLRYACCRARQPGPRGRAVKPVRVFPCFGFASDAHTENVTTKPKPPVSTLAVVDDHAAFLLRQPFDAWTRSRSRGFASSCQTRTVTSAVLGCVEPGHDCLPVLPAHQLTMPISGLRRWPGVNPVQAQAR